MQLLPDPSQTEPEAPSQTMTIVQLIISGLGAALSLLGAGLMFLFGVMGAFGNNAPTSSVVPIFSMAWITLLVGLLTIPSLVICIMRLLGRPTRLPRIPAFRIATGLLILWPVILVIGNFAANQPVPSWLVGPPLQILAVGIPIWWLVEMARRRISVGSLQRGWGILNFSLLITTPTVVVLETLLIIVIAIIGIIYVSFQPGLLTELQQLSRQLTNMRQNPDQLFTLLQPYLRNPLAIFSVFAMIAGIIPMLEELFKPLAVWVLAGRKMTPAQGFVAGVICGAAFALLESLLTLGGGQTESGWAILVIGRAGTGLLHITTTALSGWALASAWQNNTYLRLGLTYLASCGLHALWNSLSLLNGLGMLLNPAPASLSFLLGLSKISPYILIILVFMLFMILWSLNQRLSREAYIITPSGEPSGDSTNS